MLLLTFRQESGAQATWETTLAYPNKTTIVGLVTLLPFDEALLRLAKYEQIYKAGRRLYVEHWLLGSSTVPDVSPDSDVAEKARLVFIESLPQTLEDL